jgi:hypothetical protein
MHVYIGQVTGLRTVQWGQLDVPRNVLNILWAWGILGRADASVMTASCTHHAVINTHPGNSNLCLPVSQVFTMLVHPHPPSHPQHPLHPLHPLHPQHPHRRHRHRADRTEQYHIFVWCRQLRQ